MPPATAQPERIKLMESPHTELPKYKKGMIVRVKDMSDPVDPGKEKTFYLKRFLRLLDSPATLSGAIWKKRGRFDKRQRNARRVVWTDSDDDE